MNPKQYTVGSESQCFLDALNTFQLFKNELLAALQRQYGDAQGEQFFLSHTAQFEDIERAVMDYLRIQFTLQMGTSANNVTL